MSISFWLDKSSAQSQKTYDFVIVGEVSPGYQRPTGFSRTIPTQKLLFLEKNRIGFGASGRNAGFVTCGSIEHFIKLQEKFGLPKALEIWKFSEENRKLIGEHIVQDQADSVDYKSTGSCTVAPSAEHFVKYQKAIKTMKENGIDIEDVDAKPMEKEYGVTGFPRRRSIQWRRPNPSDQVIK